MNDDSRSVHSPLIDGLTRWAAVAFAARCARRVYPLCEAAGRELAHVIAVREAIELAERAAAVGNGEEAQARASEWRAELAGSGLLGGAGAYDAACAASEAADAVARAAFSDHNPDVAADDHDGDWRYSTLGAIEYAVQAIAGWGTAKEQIGQDATVLRQRAREGGWTDDTPVAADAFGPLWPGGPPAGWPSQEYDGFSLYVTAPESVGPTTIAEDVVALFKALNDVHLACGGQGLTLEKLESHVRSATYAPLTGG